MDKRCEIIIFIVQPETVVAWANFPAAETGDLCALSILTLVGQRLGGIALFSLFVLPSF
jgi:hypothetical protein